MIFDVIREPCVPVRMKSGEFKDLSVRDVFLNASKISGIFTESIFEEYGIKRFLSTFFMDCYRPKTDKDILNIYLHNSFDMVVFDNYVKDCEKRGDVFNLFSKDYPFYQTKFDPSIDKTVTKNKQIIPEKQSIYGIIYDLPSASNHNFYYKKYNIKPKDCFRALVSFSPFLYGKGGAGYCGGVNGNSPYYYWVKCENLFKELLVNSISEETCLTELKIPYSGGCGDEVIWKRTKPVNKQVSFSDISLLEGLTFMGRRITVFEPDNGNDITDVFIGPASKFEQYANLLWKDPYCCYKYIEKAQKQVFGDKKEISGFMAICPNKDDASLHWLDIGSMYNMQNDLVRRPLILNKFGNYGINSFGFKKRLSKYGLDSLNLICYGGYNPDNGGLYNWWLKEDIILDTDILDSNDLIVNYLKSLDYVKEVAHILKKSSSLITINMEYYYLSVHKYLFGEFLSVLKKTSDYDELFDSLYKHLLKYALSTYENSFKGIDILKFSKKYKDNPYVLYQYELNWLIHNIKKLNS